MHDLTTFEQQLARRLADEVDRALPTFDATRLARAAMVPRSRWDQLVNGLGTGLAMPLQPSGRAALVALVALLVLASVALAIGLLGPEGRPLAYIRAGGDVVIANADGSDPRVIGHSDFSPLRNEVAWAPGGRHLAIIGEGWTLSILDLRGTVTFSRQLDDRSSRFAWSNDGGHLAVLDGAWIHDATGPGFGPVVDPHLFIVSADGQLESSSDLPADYRYALGQGGISWSPDGAQLAIAGYDTKTARAGIASSSIWIVDHATLDAREIVSPGGLEYDVDPVWLPDGRILFSRMNGGIWQLDARTGDAVQVFAPQCPCSGHTVIPFAPSPDSKRLALLAPNVGLTVLDLASGSLTRELLPDGMGGGLPIGWTGDGAALTVMVGPITDQPFYASELGIVDIVTGELKIIANGIVAFDAAGS